MHEQNLKRQKDKGWVLGKGKNHNKKNSYFNYTNTHIQHIQTANCIYCRSYIGILSYFRNTVTAIGISILPNFILELAYKKFSKNIISFQPLA